MNIGIKKLNLYYNLKQKEFKFVKGNKYKLENSIYFKIENKEIYSLIYDIRLVYFSDLKYFALCKFYIPSINSTLNEIIVHKAMILNLTMDNNYNYFYDPGYTKNIINMKHEFNNKIELYKKELFDKWNKEFDYLHWCIGFGTGDEILTRR